MRAGDLFVWGVVFGMLIFGLVAKKFKRLKIQKMLKRAKTAEKKAITFLQKAGYTIIDTQLREEVTTYVDNQAYTNIVKADLLVRKGMKYYIVEVKTGNQTSPTLPNVRRQLLEYHLVYQPDGLLLLDMEKEKLKKVSFNYMPNKKYHYKIVLIGVLCFLLGYSWCFLKI